MFGDDSGREQALMELNCHRVEVDFDGVGLVQEIHSEVAGKPVAVCVVVLEQDVGRRELDFPAADDEGEGGNKNGFNLRGAAHANELARFGRSAGFDVWEISCEGGIELGPLCAGVEAEFERFAAKTHPDEDGRAFKGKVGGQIARFGLGWEDGEGAVCRTPLKMPEGEDHGQP